MFKPIAGKIYKMLNSKAWNFIIMFAFVALGSGPQTFQGTMYRHVKDQTQRIPVQFDLILPEGNGEVRGTCCYQENGEKIALTGNRDGQTLILSERRVKNGKITGLFNLEVGDLVTGIWHNPDGSDTFHVHLDWTYETDSITSPASIDGFWEGVMGNATVRFFLTEDDPSYGVYYLLADKILIQCEFNPYDSTITELYSDYPYKNLKGGIWKYSYVQNDTLRGELTEDLRNNPEYRSATSFKLWRRSSSFCDEFYGAIDSGFIIETEDTTHYNGALSFSRISVRNSGLDYSGIRINTPIPNQSKINQLLRTIIPLDGELKDQVLQKRKGDCTTPSEYEDHSQMEVIYWGNRYLTVMVEHGEFPRFLDFNAVIIDLQKAVLVDPSSWFKDSLQCLAFKSSREYQDYSMEDKCEELFRNFFLNFSKAGIIKLQSIAFDSSFFVIDDNEIHFDVAMISPSDEGIMFHLHKWQAINDFIDVPINYNDIKKFLSSAGIEALKPRH